MPNKIESGLLFTVPLRDGKATIGQVVAVRKSQIYIIVFDHVVEEGVIFNEGFTFRKQPSLSALTVPMFLKNGRWGIIGKREVDEHRFLPAYKVVIGSVNDRFVEDFWQKRRHAATQSDLEKLDYRTTTSPAGVERSVRILLGFEGWDDRADALRSDRVVTASEAFGDVARSPRFTSDSSPEHGAGGAVGGRSVISRAPQRDAPSAEENV